jgi:DNA (cytosine-5)-methyltransferase 1
MNPSKKPLRYLSVFSGMEAATVAWHHMGWTPVGFSEIEPFPSQILKHHYPTITNYGDITKFKQWPIERGAIDLLVGGTPCQAFSVAGLRKGLDDPRGNLALTFLALADHLRPKYILWENVPGVLSSSKGEDFASFISALAELGYGFAWRVCDAQYFGVPQRRKRVFLLAIEGAGNWRTAAEILFERKSLCGDIAESNEAGEGTPSDAGASVETSGRLFDMQAIGQYGTDGSASTCKQRDYKDATDLVVPTVLDRAAFNQGQNAQYEPFIEQTETCPTIVSRGPHAVQMPTPLDSMTLLGRENSDDLRRGFGIGKEGDPMFTLSKAHHHAVVYENRPSDSRITGPLDVAPTMTSRFGTGGGNIPLVNIEPKIIKTSELRLSGKITEQETCPTLTAGAKGEDSEPLAVIGAFKSGQGAASRSIGWSETVSPTLPANAGGNTAPAILTNKPITFQPGNLRRDAGADPSTETTTTLKASSGDQMPHIATNMAVRRLTPVECERLQGFPDNYSQIPWKGKPASECPDGPRYKACGNSFAVPVVRWIGERIQKQIDGTLPK